MMPHRATMDPPPARAANAATAVSAQATVRAAPATPPAGATMQCKDGTYLFGAPAPGRCDANGGLGGILPAARTAPPPPARQRRP